MQRSAVWLAALTLGTGACAGGAGPAAVDAAPSDDGGHDDRAAAPPESRAGKPPHATTPCNLDDPNHQWDAMHAFAAGGKMDGFEGAQQMTYYDDSDLPFYYWFASTFAVADRYFASVLSGTAPNRFYLELATSGGVRETHAGNPVP